MLIEWSVCVCCSLTFLFICLCFPCQCDHVFTLVRCLINVICGVPVLKTFSPTWICGNTFFVCCGCFHGLFRAADSPTSCWQDTCLCPDDRHSVVETVAGMSHSSPLKSKSKDSTRLPKILSATENTVTKRVFMDRKKITLCDNVF